MSDRGDRVSRRAVLAAAGGSALAGAMAVDARAAGDGGQRGRSLRVADAFYRTLQASDLDAFGALWADDAVWWAPITAQGGPGETVGRDAIVAMLRGALTLFTSLHFDWDLEPMLDPHQVLANWSLEHDFAAGGSYVNRGVALFHVRGGRIVRFAEHFDTIAWEAAFGGNDG
jgi:ketosteroid isomerase-like protein